MSTQQYSQIPASYYGLEHYPYQQYMNGSQPQLGQTQAAQSQQPLTQQLLQAQSAQYQQPYGLYYMQQVQPGQHPLQGQQGAQQTQYQQYQQQQQQQSQQQTQQQQLQTLQPLVQQSDYAVHYPGYSSSNASAPYGQYAMYQQSAAPQASSASAAPLALTYASVPSQLQATAAQQALTASLATAGTAQSAASASTSGATVQTSAPSASAKGSVLSDTLGGASNSTVGQYQPPGIRPRVTTTMWEDEKTLCYQVDANNVSVVRRADNNMINGTKLLNVAQMTRGRRDGILKLEKIRHVVKIGSMHLKGVWIPFERALAMAQREGIVDLLYPLFVRDIKRVIQTGVTPSVQTSAASSKAPMASNGSYPASTSTAASNPSMSYYQLYPSQYPPASSTHALAVPESAPQQQMATQQQLYGYSQPSYYNQSYYNQGSTAAGGNGSTNYSSYSQAPMYSSYAGYLQAAQGQAQLQKPYEQPQQSQGMTSQQLPQQGSPGAKKEKDGEKK